MNKNFSGFVALTLFLVVFVVALGAWGTVPAGSRGVELNLGRVTGQIKPEGFYTKIPFVTSVVNMDVRVQKEQVQTQAASKDLQTVNTTVSLNLSLSPDKCASVYQNIGRDYMDIIVAPALQESIKAVVAKYNAESLITNREVVRQGIAQLISEKLTPIGLRTDAVNIVNFEFSRSFNEAIENKVTAEQNALASKNKLEQTKYEAEQRIATAEGEAKAIAIQSKAIQEQGGTAYLQLKAVEKWDGKLPVYNTSTPSAPA